MSSRTARLASPTGVYHWISRGINKKVIFHKHSDFNHFKELLLQYKNENSIKIYHYCLMNNHIHMLTHAQDVGALSKFTHFLLRRYAYYYCKSYSWNGSVFKRRFKAIPVERDEYLLECARYIELNPVKAQMVVSPNQYKYSSYHHYVSRNVDPIISLSPSYKGLDRDPRIRRRIYESYVNAIRIDRKQQSKLRLV